MAVVKGNTQEELKAELTRIINDADIHIDEFSIVNHIHTPHPRPSDDTYTHMQTGRRTLTIELTKMKTAERFEKELSQYYANNTD